MRLSCAAWALGLAIGSPGFGAEPQVPVTVVLRGEPAITRAISEGLAHLGVPAELRFAEPPNRAVAEQTDATVERGLFDARRAYIDANFPHCLALLASEARLQELLGAGKRALAARTLFRRIACRVGAREFAEARHSAAQFAAFNFEVPAEVESATPEVEHLLAQAILENGNSPAVALSVDSDHNPAELSVDGKSPACRTPCTLDLHAGDHVLRLDADGVVPAIRVVRVGQEPSHVAVRFSLASPDLAAQQWTAHYTAASNSESPASLRLLALALRTRRLLLLSGERAQRGWILRGSLAVDGLVAARGERNAQAEEARTIAPRLVRDLLARGSVIQPPRSLWRRPVFWVALTLAAAAAGAAVGVAVYEEVRTVPTHTRVSF